VPRRVGRAPNDVHDASIAISHAGSGTSSGPTRNPEENHNSFVLVLIHCHARQATSVQVLPSRDPEASAWPKLAAGERRLRSLRSRLGASKMASAVGPPAPLRGFRLR
jgi:hypothetical protein